MSRSERPFVLTAPQRQTLGAACMCAAATLLVILPAVLHGFPAGHDTNFHATAWFDVIDHWKEGILFPSWGARFARGLGQPVYTFYPPLSLLLGSALTVIFGAAAAPTIFTWICVATGGFGTYLLARRFLPYPAAVIAA